MLFKCGKSVDEKYAIQQALTKKCADLMEWHKCFVWFPVVIDEKAGTCAWMQTVERKYEQANVMDWDNSIRTKYAEYRLTPK